jgi:pimeloyl-ACP methyl ester carboxylesterase
MDRRRLFTIAAAAAVPAAALHLPTPQPATGQTTMSDRSTADSGRAAASVSNIVLVHGAFADGAGWRGVYDALTARGLRVSIVQNPLTSFADDVAATRRVLHRQDGPAILVGHSYGGSVITEAGVDPKVAGLVYVAAFAPEPGQSTLDQYAEVPPPPNFVPEEQPDGFAFLNREKFRAGFAADMSEPDAAFLRDSQVPIAMAALRAKVTVAAWKSKPSWYVVATEDGAIAPELLRRTARRIGATTTEVTGSHVVFATQPRAVAAVIEAAAIEAAALGALKPAR